MRILLAEDEKSLSRVLVTIFEKNHYSVDPVYNGEDALFMVCDRMPPVDPDFTEENA